MPARLSQLQFESMLFEQHGLLVGVLLLGVVTLCAFLLGRKAARGVEQFREEHHERFSGKGPR